MIDAATTRKRKSERRAKENGIFIDPVFSLPLIFVLSLCRNDRRQTKHVSRTGGGKEEKINPTTKVLRE
jgi:hypothetical protein